MFFIQHFLTAHHIHISLKELEVRNQRYKARRVVTKIEMIRLQFYFRAKVSLKEHILEKDIFIHSFNLEGCDGEINVG